MNDVEIDQTEGGGLEEEIKDLVCLFFCLVTDSLLQCTVFCLFVRIVMTASARGDPSLVASGEPIVVMFLQKMTDDLKVHTELWKMTTKNNFWVTLGLLFLERPWKKPQV